MTPARDYLAPIGHGDCAPQKAKPSDQAFVCRHSDPRCEDDPCPAGIRWMCDASAIRNLGDKA